MNAMEKEFDALVSEHLDGAPSLSSTQRLDQIMSSHPRFRREYSMQILMHRLLLEACGNSSAYVSRCLSIPWPLLKRTPRQKAVAWLRRLLRRPACPSCEKQGACPLPSYLRSPSLRC